MVYLGLLLTSLYHGAFSLGDAGTGGAIQGLLTIRAELSRIETAGASTTMRLATLTLALVLLAPLAGLGAASGQTLKVPLDQAARVRLSRPVHDIILGNPAIADVTVMDSRHLMIIGKGYGVTNLMVTDEGGRTIFNRQVAVGAPDAGYVSVYRGAEVSQYACAPHCQRTAGSSAAAAPAAQP
jgi:Flp pilus assembly secretin CpaC